ncbi:hypothetical protein WM28_10665 [Burkholderia ubonensis]|uniref:hypothetical protein n=1 Tax=Burkholderia ubonensis TaxID=101571 RepID=UPI0007531DD5|nr:hypothetical protein [Burkholderia ubonensis]KVT86358.1 hypothetical protein WK59_10170 [Burkholderia ubonensis]KWO52935.1 hypothetical protein WM28_10665 [Burkholderia ubonensis]
MSTPASGTVASRILTYMRAMREKHPDGLRSPAIADALELDKDVVASTLGDLHRRRCVSRERDSAYGRGLSYLYRYLTDTPTLPPLDSNRRASKQSTGHVSVGDMLILIPIGKSETMQVTIEDARSLYRHLHILFGRSK